MKEQDRTGSTRRGRSADRQADGPGTLGSPASPVSPVKQLGGGHRKNARCETSPVGLHSHGPQLRS